MIGRTKRSSLILLGITLIAILLLSASISSLELEKGAPQKFGGGDALPEPLTPITPFTASEFNRIINNLIDVAMILVFWVLVPLSVLVYLFSPGDKRKKLRNIGLAILVILILPYIMQKLTAQIEPKTMEAETLIIPTTLPATEIPSLVFGEPSKPFVFLATMLFIGALVGLGWFAWRKYSRTPGPVDQLMQEAEQAITEIRSGSDIKDTILRCYFQMNQIVQATRGYKRDEAMTPREFEEELIEFGLPGDRVLQLTRLFERARYGAANTQTEDESEAIGCLEAIVDACGGKL